VRDAPPIVVPPDLAQRADLGATAKLLLALMGQISRATGLCWMREAAMAQRIGTSTRHVRRLLRQLERRGEIRMEIASAGRPRPGAEPGRAWRVLWNRPRLGPAKAPAAAAASSDLPDEGGQMALAFPEEGGQDVRLSPEKADKMSGPTGQDVREKPDKMSGSSCEVQQYRQTVRGEKRNSRDGNGPGSPAAGSACSVNGHGDGHDHDGHQKETTADPPPSCRTRPTADPTATAAARLQTTFTETADSTPAFRALTSLRAADWTAKQAKAARDRHGDEAIIAAIRYALHQQPPPHNPGGFIRRALEGGWYAPAPAVRQRGAPP
jgi:hypothetical protein